MSHPALTVKKYLGAKSHVRKFFQVIGLSPPIDYLVHNSSINNLARGVLTRVLLYKGKPVIQPIEGAYKKKLRKFRRAVLKKFSTTTPVTRQCFVEYYKGRMKLVYQRAVDSLQYTSVKIRDSFIKAFVKAEFIKKKTFSLKELADLFVRPDPDPRVISPRDPRYNVEVGRYLRPIEHRIYRAIADIFGEITVLKGFNSEQTGALFQKKWSKFSNPVAVGLDASRFDQHVSQDALRWEHSVYNGIYKSVELQNLLKMQLQNNVKGYCRDGTLRFKTNGCRMSGDMNTALGNCLIMCALVHAYSESLNIKVSLANNGDDCVVIMESDKCARFVSGLTKWFSEMGFVMKVEQPVFELEKIEFCQTHPVFVGDRYLMVRNQPTSLAKDCLSLKQLKVPHIAKSWLTSVGECGLSMSGGVPVCQEFYLSLIRFGLLVPDSKRAKSSRCRHKVVPESMIRNGLQWLSRGMCLKYSNITSETRYSYWLAFGVTPEQQIAIESELRKVQFSYHLVEKDRQVHLPSWW